MRVLLIEDDSAVARSIELMLKSAGFNIYTTDLGEEGVDLGKVYEYDMNRPGYALLLIKGTFWPLLPRQDQVDINGAKWFFRCRWSHE